MINGAEPSDDGSDEWDRVHAADYHDASDDFYNEDWIPGVDFYACATCWQDVDSFEVDVIPGVTLSGELHREPEWDAVCNNKRILRLRDSRRV